MGISQQTDILPDIFYTAQRPMRRKAKANGEKKAARMQPFVYGRQAMKVINTRKEICERFLPCC